ncbi:MAG: OmpA family protein [Gemmatimonadales bacterium]|nr:OmpA family protein [Gemmatimonadales bacterium]MDZ4389607.1 OmpA family protein [Gemmatimonadales bacterium]
MRTTARIVLLPIMVLASSLVVVSGCATKAQTGVIVGAGGGAVVGGAIGKVAGSTAKGAIVGAVVGGVAGGLIGARMDRQAKELEQNIKGATVERVGEGIQVTFASGLLYDFDSDAVKLDARTNLRELALSLDKYPGTEVIIIGHTDAVGTESYNQALSERRSRAAASYLMSQGVDGTRIGARGLGEMEPIASNDTEAGRAVNRRVEVAIYASEAYREQVRQSGTP